MKLTENNIISPTTNIDSESISSASKKYITKSTKPVKKRRPLKTKKAKSNNEVQAIKRVPGSPVVNNKCCFCYIGEDTNPEAVTPVYAVTSGMHNKILAVAKKISSHNHIAIVDPTHRWSTSFLKEVANACLQECPKRNNVYISLANVKSKVHFMKIWAENIVNILGRDILQRRSYFEKYLIKYGYNYSEETIVDGRRRTTIIHLFGGPTEISDEMSIELFKLGNRICEKHNKSTILFIDHVDGIAQNKDSDDLIYLFRNFLWVKKDPQWNKNHVTVVTATGSKKLNRYITGLAKEKDHWLQQYQLEPISEASFRNNIRFYLGDKDYEVDNDCLERLCEMTHYNLHTAIELIWDVWEAKRSSKNKAKKGSNGTKKLEINALEEAFNAKLNKREYDYRHKTDSLSDDTYHALDQFSKEWSKKDPDAIEAPEKAFKEMPENIKDELITSGILYQWNNRLYFVDPLYQYWLQNRYSRDEEEMDLIYAESNSHILRNGVKKY